MPSEAKNLLQALDRLYAEILCRPDFIEILRNDKMRKSHRGNWLSINKEVVL